MTQMATLVLEQDEHVVAIENNAVQTSGDMNQGCVPPCICRARADRSLQSQGDTEGGQVCPLGARQALVLLLPHPRHPHHHRGRCGGRGGQEPKEELASTGLSLVFVPSVAANLNGSLAVQTSPWKPCRPARPASPTAIGHSRPKWARKSLDSRPDPSRA